MTRKKLLALGMASLMVVSTFGTVLAADETVGPASGTIAGTGGIEGFVDKDVFTVTLPTTADVNFSIDPQELKLATDTSYKVDDAAAAAGYGKKVLFTSADSKVVTKSQDITVVNKSTYAIDVKVTAKVTGLTKEGASGYTIKLVDDTPAEGASSYDWGKDAALSLKLTPTPGTYTGTTVSAGSAEAATVLTDTANGITVTNKVDAIANVTDAYEVKNDSGYKYQLKADVSSVAFNEITYNLSGTVNTDADWTNFNKDDSRALTVDLAYTVDKHVDGPQVALSADGKITISNLTADKNFTGYKDVVITLDEDDTSAALQSTTSTFDGTNWTTDGGTAVFQLGSKWSVWNDKPVTVTVTLTDSSTIEIQGTYKIQ